MVLDLVLEDRGQDSTKEKCHVSENDQFPYRKCN